MQINLGYKDVTKALDLYLNHIGINTVGQDVEYSFSCKRKGDAGIQASVSITPASVKAAPVQKQLELPIEVVNEAPREPEVVAAAPEPEVVAEAPKSLFD